MYRLVIFDFDGVLADSAAWFARALNEIAPRHGFRRAGEAELEALRGRTNRQVLADLGVARWRLPFIAADLRRRMAAEAGSIHLFEGVEAAIERLAASGTALAIVSSNAEGNVRRILGTETGGRVSFYDCGAGLFGKAARFRRVMRRGGFAPHETLCIGDELRDLEAAHAVGAASGAVVWGYATAESLARGGATLTFRHVEEIAARLAPPPA
jgi:phosphoglycolate phosphatase